MKKFIGEKLYDTDESELIHTWRNPSSGPFGPPPSSPPFSGRLSSSESLYRTSKGNWFIVINDKDFSPVSKEGALEWCKRYADTDVLLHYFRDDIERA